jgi:phage-related protein
VYEVITYKDRNGKDEITEYLYELAEKKSKDARIKLNKIMEYIRRLEASGTATGEPAVKHIVGTDLWELRPINDRIFFAYWTADTFILLHHFEKKSQKTQRREIEAAERKLKDFLERYGK